MKNAKKYVDLYLQIREEYYEKWGEYSPAATPEEFEDDLLETYHFHLKGIEEEVMRVKMYITMLSLDSEYGIF